MFQNSWCFRFWKGDAECVCVTCNNTLVHLSVVRLTKGHAMWVNCAFPQERHFGSGQVLLPKSYKNIRGFQGLWGLGISDKNSGAV